MMCLILSWTYSQTLPCLCWMDFYCNYTSDWESSSTNRISFNTPDQLFLTRLSEKCSSPCARCAAAPCRWPTGLWVRRCCFAVDACAEGTCPLRPAAPASLLYSPSDTDLSSAGAAPEESRGHHTTMLSSEKKCTERAESQSLLRDCFNAPSDALCNFLMWS